MADMAPTEAALVDAEDRLWSEIKKFCRTDEHGPVFRCNGRGHRRSRRRPRRRARGEHRAANAAISAPRNVLQEILVWLRSGDPSRDDFPGGPVGATAHDIADYIEKRWGRP